MENIGFNSDFLDISSISGQFKTKLNKDAEQSQETEYEVFIWSENIHSSAIHVYDQKSYLKNKKLTLLGGGSGVIDLEKHKVVTLQKGKNRKHKISTKKGEVDFFKGKNIVLHRAPGAKGKRLETLKSKNIVLIEMSDEQYANVSSFARDVFSQMSDDAKKEKEKKKLEGESSHKLLDRLKKNPEGTLEKETTRRLGESHFSEHSRKSGDSPNETQEKGIHEKREIKRKADKKDERFKKTAIYVEVKKENKEDEAQESNLKEQKGEESLKSELDNKRKNVDG